MLAYLLDRHLHVQTSTRDLGFFKRPDARNTKTEKAGGRGEREKRTRQNQSHVRRIYIRACEKGTHYASRLCISGIAGMLRTFENGLHLFRTSHHPDKESPKFRGELSSVCTWMRYKVEAQCDKVTYRTNVYCNDSIRSHREHGRYLEKESFSSLEKRNVSLTGRLSTSHEKLGQPSTAENDGKPTIAAIDEHATIVT